MAVGEPGRELGPRPGGAAAAVRQQHDAVGRLHQPLAVGHRNDGGAPAQRPERRGDFAFGCGVERAGGLVEHQERGPAEQRPRQHDPLALAPRQPRAAVSDHRLEAVRQGGHEVGGDG